MDAGRVNLDLEVIEFADTSLESRDIEGSPIRHQLVEPPARSTSVPGFVGQISGLVIFQTPK
jgi:hypothetical protein